jgi:hypothetical protein
MTQRLARWAAGIPEERRFWDGWIASRGGQWPEDFAWRMNPAAPLWPFPAQVATALDQPSLRLLACVMPRSGNSLGTKSTLPAVI